MVNADDLKSSDLWVVQVRVLLRAPALPISLIQILGRSHPLRVRRLGFLAPRLPFSRLPRTRSARASVLPRVQSCPHVVRCEQFFQGIPIQQGRSLIVLLGPIDFDPVDLSGILEDLSDPQGLVRFLVENLLSERVDDPVAPIDRECAGGHRISRAASRSAEELEGSGGLHGNGNHTRRRGLGSSGSREPVASSNPVCASLFTRACSEEADDRQERVGARDLECDAEVGVIVVASGGTEESRVDRLSRPRDPPCERDLRSAGKTDRKLDLLSRWERVWRADAEAFESDLGANGSIAKGASIGRRQLDRAMEAKPIVQSSTAPDSSKS